MTSRARRRLRVPTLDAVLAYENEHVIDRFVATFAVGRRVARALFRDVLRLLWLCARADQLRVSPGLLVVPGMELLDEMWHAFLLFTEAYERFCVGFFGRVIHHDPGTRDDAPLDDDDLHRYVTLAFDELGEATATRIFRTQPARYTPQFLDAHRVPYARGRRPDAPGPPRTPARRGGRRRGQSPL